MLTDRDVRQLVADVLEVGVADVGLDTSFYDELDMTSLHKADLVVALEHACGVELTAAEAAGIDTVRDVLRVLGERVPDERRPAP